MDYEICSECGHSVKLGLTDEDGRCPVCRGGPDGEESDAGEEEY